jgi:hypothetical protein
MAYDVDTQCEGPLPVVSPDETASAEFPASSTVSNKSAGFPTRIFRTIRNNLGRVSGLKQTSSERSFPELAKEKKPSFRKDPLDEQMNIAKRVSRHLTDVLEGSNEPHPLFVGEREPPISFTNYVERLIELTNKWVEEADGADSFGVRCTMLAVEYLERIDVRLDSKSIHRNFTTAFLIAIKLLYDYYISNSFWAEVSGCPRKQVNQMEIQMCRLLRWDFTADVEKHARLVRQFVR